MKTGYDDFFKKARQGSSTGRPLSSQRDQVRFSLPKEVKAKARPRPQGGGSDLSKEKMQILRERIKQRKGKKKVKFPLRLVLGSTVGLVLTAVGFLYHDRLDDFIGRIEIEAFGGARAEGNSAAPAQAEKPKENSTESSTARTPAAVDQKAVRQLSEDEIDHLQKLVQRKEQLDAREAELQRLESEIQAQNAELDKKLQSLEQTRQGISTLLQERTTKDEAKVETLVQMYSNMKPAQAAKILETMDEDLAVEIIGRMKKKNAAEVLNLMKAEKAQVFSEKFAGYRKR